MTAATHHRNRRRRHTSRVIGRLIAITFAASFVCAMIVLRVWLAQVGQ
jgi:hypothetical protein